MKIRGRTLLIVIALLAIPLAVASYINASVIPENRRTALALMQQLGEQFETTGIYPKADTIQFDQLKLGSTVELQATVQGTVANQWGQEIKIVSALIPNPADDGGDTLDLTVISNGPFGVVGACSVTASFEREVGDQNQRLDLQ